MRKRIWELDAFRGICIIGVVLVHLVYDLVELYRILPWQYPAWFSFVKDWGGVLFVLLSGVCATLGSRSVKRGLIVFAAGMLCTAVTLVMGCFGFNIPIYFGVLHCLGVCMIAWWLFRRLPTAVLAVLGAVLVAVGLWLQNRVFPTGMWLIPLGLTPPEFFSSDYFPLLPNLGYFLLGAVIGRLAYRKKESLLPGVPAQKGVLAFFQFCGRQSLWIYLLHQPILSGVCCLLRLCLA